MHPTRSLAWKDGRTDISSVKRSGDLDMLTHYKKRPEIVTIRWEISIVSANKMRSSQGCIRTN